MSDTPIADQLQAVAELVKMNYPIRRRMTGGCREYIFGGSHE